ncbi:hypothetical protein ACNKHN_12840 [Shigella flexneri]
MTPLQLSILLIYCRRTIAGLAGFVGSKVEPIPQNHAGDNSLVVLKLLSPDGDNGWSVMYKLSQALSHIEVHVRCRSVKVSRCLFAVAKDQFAATRPD